MYRKAAGAIDLNVTLGQTPCRAVPPFTIARKEEEEEEEEEEKKSRAIGAHTIYLLSFKGIISSAPCSVQYYCAHQTRPRRDEIEERGGWKLQ